MPLYEWWLHNNQLRMKNYKYCNENSLLKRQFNCIDKEKLGRLRIAIDNSCYFSDEAGGIFGNSEYCHKRGKMSSKNTQLYKIAEE